MHFVEKYLRMHLVVVQRNFAGMVVRKNCVETVVEETNLVGMDFVEMNLASEKNRMAS